MKKTADNIILKYYASKPEHANFKKMYSDVFKYGMPGRFSNVSFSEKGIENRDEIFSSVFEQSCDEFVQRFQSLVCPVNTDWVDFEAGYIYDKDNNNVSDVNKELSKIANILNVYKSTSNYDTAFTEACYDLIAGTTCMCLLEGTPDNPMIFSVIPFNQLTMEEGIDGEIEAYYRKFSIKNKLIDKQWVGANHEYEKGTEDDVVDILECTYYDNDINRWHYVVINIEKKIFIIERIYKCSPFIDLRWTKCAGETYGRGPGLKVIADVKTLNKIKEYSLRALSFSVPTFTCAIDEGYDPSKFELQPGAINPVPSNLTTNPTIRQLEVNPMPELGNYNAQQLEMDIKRSMFASTIPNDPNPRMTATEVAQRVSELDNSLNNGFGRLLSFLYRMSRRMIEVCQKFGFISPELDVLAFNGYGFKIKINTHLANQQTKKEVYDIINSIQVMSQFDPSLQFASKVIKMEELIPYIMDKMGIPNKFIRSSEEIKVLEEQQAQAMAQAKQQEFEMDIEASNAKELGKARANGR